MSYLSLRDLKERFRPIVLFGKLANIGDDISSRPIEESDVLKKIISGQNIPAEQKGKDAIEFANYAKLIYTANKLPSFQDRTSGMMRRMMLIEINRKVTNPDPFFMSRVLDEDYEYLLLKAVQAIRGVLKRNAFTNVESVNESLRVFRQSQSSVLAFIDEYKLTQDNLDGNSVSMIYSNYKQYCEDNGYKALNQGNFRKEMSDELKLNILNTTNGPGTPQQVRFKKIMEEIVFDIEVFPQWWCIVYSNPENTQVGVIQSTDSDYMKRINDIRYGKCLIGFNIKRYDLRILHLIISGGDPTDVHALSKAIIDNNETYPFNNYFYWRKFNFSDLYDDWRYGSLKAFESNIGMSIKESSISFDKRDLTDTEKEEIISYCKHDVKATCKLLEVRREYVDAKKMLANTFSLNLAQSLKSTVAKLGASVLGAKKEDMV